MNYLKFLILLLPVPFLFHFYEYEQHVRNQDASFLFVGFIFFIILSGIISSHVKFVTVVILTIFQTLISLYLASNFIENDTYWFKPFEFKPFDRDKVIIIFSVLYFLGQLVVRMIVNRVKRSPVKNKF
jgi:hypothetical protein